jgi:hypothetical protein
VDVPLIGTIREQLLVLLLILNFQPYTGSSFLSEASLKQEIEGSKTSEHWHMDTDTDTTG